MIGQNAGLPNIKGWVDNTGCLPSSAEGAMYLDSTSTGGGDWSESSRRPKTYFDASKGECKTDGSYKASTDYKVYGKSDTVQTQNLTIRYWKRTA